MILSVLFIILQWLQLQVVIFMAMHTNIGRRIQLWPQTSIFFVMSGHALSSRWQLQYVSQNAAKIPIRLYSAIKVYPSLHKATKIGILHELFWLLLKLEYDLIKAIKNWCLHGSLLFRHWHCLIQVNIGIFLSMYTWPTGKPLPHPNQLSEHCSSLLRS